MIVPTAMWEYDMESKHRTTKIGWASDSLKFMAGNQLE